MVDLAREGCRFGPAYLKSEFDRLDIDPAKSVVAVSGGADSLALLHAMAKIGLRAALTVDHGLRPEARDEAAFVKSICDTLGVAHETLEWTGEKPNANIQAQARDARYALMEAWCAQKGYRYLVTAHHQGDQAETFFQRLARGSGIYGLAAMKPVASGRYHADVERVKPLLDIQKTALIDYLKAEDISWVEDPSNQDTAYDRVKIRQFLQKPPLEGLSATRIAATAKRLSRTRAALNHYIDQWLRTYVTSDKFGTAHFDVTAFDDAPEEIILRSLATLIQFVGGADYVPRFEKLEALMTALTEKDFSGGTLGGVQFIAEGETKRILVREFSAVPEKIALSQSMIWDNRYHVTLEGAIPEDIAQYYIRPLGDDGWRDMLAHDNHLLTVKPSLAVRRSIPAIYTRGELRAVPVLGYNGLNDFTVNMSLTKNDISKI